MTRIFLRVCAAAFWLLPAHAADRAAGVAWVQLGPGGVNEVRIAASEDKCPALIVEGAQVATRLRAAPDENFPVRICSLALPPTAKQASALGHNLPLLTNPPNRILVIGDTGCRIKGSAVQACNDPAKWPFPLIAREAAKRKPDLVLDVGDYLYREQPCPADNAGCAGTPSGDNWATWSADFFTPAAPLLGAAPWIMVRGNHEDCNRAGAGWQRLLGPLSIAGAACAEHVSPYAVALGGISLAVVDDASAPDLYADGSVVPDYVKDFASLAKLARGPEWLAMHRPIWGAVKGPFGITMGGNRTLIRALKSPAELSSIQLMLSGHIHAFEALNYEGLPPQIVAGNSGDRLDSVPEDLAGANLGGRKVKDGLSLPGFGFLMLTRDKNDAWTVDLYRVDGARERQCHFAKRHIDCGKE